MILLQKIQKAQELLPILQKCLTEIQEILAGATVETDAFVIFIKNSRKSYRHKCWRATKSDKRIKDYIYTSWQEARSEFNFRGSYEIWEHILVVEPRKKFIEDINRASDKS